ncbi:hypothetical protein [Candidatus Paracaedibacter symbiosus]|uniref:hypothetical protein n=1 Tax=Candidatus Paracaedibacter symbiosus TaxID=244582 RepID=UPI0012ECB5F1|nr:hypothetical protein [Candidatus Paracaedibacter symbiosus]
MSLSAAGEEEQKICLVASPGFAVNYGVNYYRKAQQKLQQALPNYEVQLGIACDDQPGFALEAIAARVDRLYFLKSSSYWAKIDSLCHEAGIRLFDQEQLSCL